MQNFIGVVKRGLSLNFSEKKEMGRCLDSGTTGLLQSKFQGLVLMSL